jgi:hypothetical protein
MRNPPKSTARALTCKSASLTVGAVLALTLCTAAHAAGAIAIESNPRGTAKKIGYGLVTGLPSRDAAGKAAMRRCLSAGNASCKIAVRFDTCGAYAIGPSRWGTGWGNTQLIAQKQALANCAQGCRIITSGCN